MNPTLRPEILLVIALFSACTTQIPLPTPALPSATAAISCRAVDVKPGTGSALVAVADRAPLGVAFVLDSATGTVRGRVDVTSKAPEVALDATGNQLVVLCESAQSPQLVAFDLDTMAERWRVATTDPHTTKATGGLPTLGVSRDGELLFVQHAKALRADAEAPGGSRYWLSVHDARSGSVLREIDLPDCGSGSRLVAGAPTSVTVICKDGARVAEAPTWRIARTLPLPSLGPVALVGDSLLLGITPRLQVVGVDLRTGATFEDSRWEQGTERVTHWGRLTTATDGTRLWVLTARAAAGATDQAPPDTLTEINLTTRHRTDTAIQDLRGVGLVGTRLLYFLQGRLRSTDGGLDVLLLNGPVHYWRAIERTV